MRELLTTGVAGISAMFLIFWVAYIVISFILSLFTGGKKDK